MHARCSAALLLHCCRTMSNPSCLHGALHPACPCLLAQLMGSRREFLGSLAVAAAAIAGFQATKSANEPQRQQKGGLCCCENCSTALYDIFVNSVWTLQSSQCTGTVSICYGGLSRHAFATVAHEPALLPPLRCC